MQSNDGQLLGPYRLLARLGQGGMATVFKASHERLNRMVAIKMMHQAFLQDQNFLARFEREAQIVASLEHPHIVPVYDFADHTGQPYLVMKFIEGRTLKQFLADDTLPLDEILRILPPIADALDYAHRKGVLHRDIKPSNVIIDNDGTPYLTDFGLARMAQMGESTLSHDVLLGTPHYISPEQAMGRRDLTPATDIYSLGVVLYELIVGQVPFSADTPFAVIHDHIYRALPSAHTINPEVSAAVSGVLAKALAKDPTARFASASAMVAAFREAIAASGMTALSPNRVQTAGESIARLREEQDRSGTLLTPPPITTRDTPPPVLDIDQTMAGGTDAAFTPTPAALASDVPRAPAPPAPPPLDVPPPRFNAPRDGEPRSRGTVEARVDLGDWQNLDKQVGGVIRGAKEVLREGIRQEFSKEFRDDVRTQFRETGRELKAAGREFHDEIRDARSDEKRKREDYEDGSDRIRRPNPGELAAEAAQDTADAIKESDLDLAYPDDEAAILRRVLHQRKKRQEFWGHFTGYAISNAFLFFLLHGLLEINFPVAPIVALSWGSGMLAHGIETFYDTGKRAAARTRLVHVELRRLYGNDWLRAADRRELRRMRRRVLKPSEKRREFFQHAVVYLCINLMLWVIWGATSSVDVTLSNVVEIVTQGDGFPWPLFATFGWGIGLFFNALEALGAGRENKSTMREVEIERARLNSPDLSDSQRYTKRKSDEANAPAVRLTSDGELTESMAQEINQEERHRLRGG